MIFYTTSQDYPRLKQLLDKDTKSYASLWKAKNVRSRKSKHSVTVRTSTTTLGVSTSSTMI